MCISVKCVFKSGFMFTIKLAEVDKEKFLRNLFREYHDAIIDYNIVNDILDYVEIAYLTGNFKEKE